MLAVLGLFQSTLEDHLLNLPIIQMDLPTAAVPQPQPAVEHDAIPNTARWCIDFCVKLHLQSQKKIEQEGESNLRRKGKEAVRNQMKRVPLLEVTGP